MVDGCGNEREEKVAPSCALADPRLILALWED